MTKVDTEDKINKAKISITYSNPFFAYLSLYLNIEEDKYGIIPENAGMAITPNGHLYYRKEFVDKISDRQLLGVLLHEELHLALLHLVRVGKKNRLKFNIASDLCVNTILLKNGYELPMGLKPNNKNEFVALGKTIKNIDSKSAEEIYEELPEIPQDKKNVYVTFDIHGKGEVVDENGKIIQLTESELQKIETEWFNKIQTAMVMSQQRGRLPAGLERYVDELKKAEINWRVVLRRFIQQSIPNDYSWSKRNKRGQALDIYLPSTTKEKISIAVGVDTSGSIEQKELTKFLSEIISISNTYKQMIDMRIFFHDYEVQNDYVIKNGNIAQIMAMKPKGGGGTSHKPLLDKIKKEVKDCKCLIAFSDGYSDIEDIKLNDYKFTKLFIINKHGTIPKIKKNDAIFIKLKED